MGEKEGILQFLFHSLMIRQQPRHVACLECLSLHSEHESYCVRRGKKEIYAPISVHTYVHKQIIFECVFVLCLQAQCPQDIVRKSKEKVRWF